MPRVIQCPSCEKKLKIPDEKLGAAIKCPGCGKAFKTRKPKPSPQPADDEFDDLLPSDDLEAPPMPGKMGTSPGRKRASAGTYPIGPFIKKWSMVVGAICGVAVLVGLGGFASEIVGLIAAIMCVVACIGFVLVGRTWMSIDLGREKLWLGWVSFFVPLVGIAITAKEKGPSLRGATVYISAIIPALLGLAMVSVFEPMHSGAGKAASRAAKAASNLESLEGKIAADAPINTATYQLSGQIPPTLAADAEALFSEYSMYVPGSAKVDETARTLTIEYRGGRVVLLGLGILLDSKTERLLVHPKSPTKPAAPVAPNDEATTP